MTSLARQPMPEVDGTQHIYVNAGGLRMHVAQAGPADGPPVMLLHGWPQHWWLWREVIGPLAAAGYRVHAPDLRGLGWSEATERSRDYDKRQFARDIVALLDVLEIDRVRLAGHDWGGWTGFLLAITEPDRVDRFMALNIPPPWLDPGPFDLRKTLRATSRLWYQAVMSTPGLSRYVLAGGGRKLLVDGLVKGTVRREAWDNGVLETFLDQFEDPKRSRATTYIYRNFLLRELPAIQTGKYVKGRLTVPTRLLFGADDVAIDRASVDLDHSRFADDLVVEIVEGCGHFIVDERPGLVAERLIDFFK